MSEKFNENGLGENNNENVDEPAVSKDETKTESGYEQNDNWEFEAKAFTLDDTVVESDEYEITIPEKLEDDTLPETKKSYEPLDKPKRAAKEEPETADKKEKKPHNPDKPKFILAAIFTVIIIAVLVFLGVRYYTVPNSDEKMNPGNVAVTVGDTDVSIGMYNYYYTCISQNYISYAGYGYYDLDTTKDYSSRHIPTITERLLHGHKSLRMIPSTKFNISLLITKKQLQQVQSLLLLRKRLLTPTSAQSRAVLRRKMSL